MAVLVTPARGAGVRFHPLVFIAFTLLAVMTNYPGRLNEDSFEQVIGAANHLFLTDHHSPTVTWLWNLPSPLLGQPAAALLVQSLLLAFYAAVLPAALPRGTRAVASLAVEILFKLSLVVSAGFIIKDVLLTGLILCSLAALQLAQSGRATRAWLVFCGVLLMVTLLVRPTNFLMLTIACALCLPLVVPSIRSYVAALAVAAGILVLSVPLYGAINRWIFRARPAHVEIHFFLLDVAGISSATGLDLFSQLPGWSSAKLPPLEECYSAKSVMSFAPYQRCGGYLAAMRQVGASHGYRQFYVWWLRSVASHPFAYARHRAAYAVSLFDSYQTPDPQWIPYLAAGRRHLYALNTPDRVEDVRRAARGRIGLQEIDWWQGNALSSGFATLRQILFDHRRTELAALLFCILLSAWNWHRHRNDLPVDLPSAVAAGIGIGNAGMHVFLGVASQSRFLLPTLCCAVFGAIAALKPRAQPLADLDEPVPQAPGKDE
jgi:hypothetical protein